MENKYQKQIETCPEYQLYMIINSIGGIIFYTNHDLADGRIKSTETIEQNLKTLQNQIECAVDQTIRFSVKESRKDNRPTDEYWKWFHKWDKWYKAMDNKTKNKFYNICEKDVNDPRLDKYLPKFGDENV